MENGLVTADGTKVLTVQEYDSFLQAIPESKRTIFEINTITGLRYVELQRLYDNPAWYYKERNQIILPKEAQQKAKQKQIKRTIDKLPSTFPYIFKQFIEGHKPPERSSWNRNLERWSLKAGITPKVGPKSPRKTIESWMLKCGIPEIEIFSRQGHDPVTSLRHYQSLSFTDYEMRDIQKRLAEWGILRA
ncbi:integrase [Methanosarcina sp. 2.H.T.1A.6]|uniref:tyrosine-type recombinase/integrase n=1 Tax=unclassified Methanosarcina TaxID=2644672 RepID=UPI000621BE9C|nr:MULTISPECIES: tyrosine-type recombinase/integrase [unclassified Methanosarcina]KKG16013.1 integrase [Methanosarcina sp. 2.H.T.1A.3]KKG21294.1 integrase [Methanosarcina sp. 2.H.T.1A.6]KKG24138.1 integrase [Methanosarcina sp. 2.H.T.1A.8]KKG28685.1 integrase [Methanosarcina sp. 2.H.T.1A.15]